LGKKKEHIQKKKLGSFSSLTVVISLTLSLCVIGILGSLLLHTKKLADFIKNNIELHVYLDPNIPQGSVNKLQTLFSIKPYVKTIDGEEQITYISEKEAIEKFISETGEDFTEILDVSPIRSSFILKISDEFSSSQQLKKLQKEIELMQGVFQVDFREDLVDDINQNIKLISIVLLLFSALLILAVIILMNNTIRLALFSQRFIIRSMQLVGATNVFISRPFVLRGAFQGFLSGLIASTFIIGMLNYAYQKIEDLRLLEDSTSLFILLGIISLFGAIVGLISTLVSVKKYLRYSLDELYG